ncbi:MAG: GC-type dockerin domain-anchored protein [Phycisphaerales bacterium]
MRVQKTAFALAITACAGAAIAQPTIDGIFDEGTEGTFYSDVIWVQNNATGFGDNSAGLFQGGDFGNPEVVSTGIEIAIPLADLGLTGTETIRLAGWVNSGDRSFKSNQIIGDLPIDTLNLGGPQDFNDAPFDATTQHIEVDLSTISPFGPTVDGSIGADAWSQVFLQGNFTGFGDETDGTVDGSGPNGGGSEIDGIYMAKDATNLYIFVAGNLENNGNAIDLYIDTGAGGDSTLGSGLGDGGFVVSGQAGLTFDSGFDADYVFSVDAWNDDEDDGTTPNVPRAFFGPIGSDIDDLGSLAGYGAANAGSLSGGVQMGIDNSNIEGVIGSQSESTPVSPDANWAYGSELNNVRTFIDVPNNSLYVFIAGNMENNFNKLNLFFDVQAGGQNVLLDTNVDISFNGLNGMSGITFDSGFEPDYWINVNNGVDGGSGDLNNFADAATLRTNGVNIDPDFGVITDYGSFFGGEVDATPVIDFSGPRVDIQDGAAASLFSNYAPRLLAVDPFNPIDGLIQISIDNSNVDGVTGDAADSAAASAVNTGIELRLDLDEIGWDGSQDILMGGWISNDGFSFISNQVLGGIPDGSGNVGERDSDGDGTNDLDYNTIAGNQFINLSNPDVGTPCPADLTGEGDLNFLDVSAFLAAFGMQDPSADFTGEGSFNFLDVSAFLAAFAAGCP